MRTIPLTKGQVALVDDADYETLNQHTWFAIRPRHTYYAARWDKRRFVFMHVAILGGVKVDHIDRNGLNNQRHNFRPCNTMQNAANAPLHSDNQTGFKGVSGKSPRGYVARIRASGQTLYLGYFLDATDAARAYDAAARRLHGEFAWTNADHGLL